MDKGLLTWVIRSQLVVVGGRKPLVLLVLLVAAAGIVATSASPPNNAATAGASIVDNMAPGILLWVSVCVCVGYAHVDVKLVGYYGRIIAGGAPPLAARPQPPVFAGLD
jgi:hypothetical protein